MSKYLREIKPGVLADVYDVLKAWNVTNPATQHAIKKLLQPGARGHKDLLTDLREAAQSLERAIELETPAPVVGSGMITAVVPNAHRGSQI